MIAGKAVDNQWIYKISMEKGIITVILFFILKSFAVFLLINVGSQSVTQCENMCHNLSQGVESRITICDTKKQDHNL